MVSKHLKSWMALYGSVVIQRAICPQCGRTALVIDRVMACCGTEPPPPTGFKRECLPDGLRHLPPIAARRERLRIQENKCFYCLNTFGMRVLRGRQILRLRLEWDHLLPFAYAQDNSSANFVAACYICNRMKSDKLFKTTDEVRSYVAQKWKQKGLVPLPSLRDGI
jgi:hypothetical protein